ncbi:MAG: hypothetical protein RBT37_08620 [Dissulfurispiraceae bacterium]|jgi:5S rRNA maturation endonuclease (ribonuclease M5)|nr:hypothetical protein [Dissulfurispiraceae bacterium]
MQINSIDLDRSARIQEALQHLYELNKRIPVVVEGIKDVKALRETGLTGEIITIHTGKSLYEFAESISTGFHKIILLTDWDEKGEQLLKAVGKETEGMWEEFSGIRDLLKILCQKDIKDIESIPSLLLRLSGSKFKVEETKSFLGDI